jgi:hypothetical protein
LEITFGVFTLCYYVLTTPFLSPLSLSHFHTHTHINVILRPVRDMSFDFVIQ